MTICSAFAPSARRTWRGVSAVSRGGRAGSWCGYRRRQPQPLLSEREAKRHFHTYSYFPIIIL